MLGLLRAPSPAANRPGAAGRGQESVNLPCNAASQLTVELPSSLPPPTSNSLQTTPGQNCREKLEVQPRLVDLRLRGSRRKHRSFPLCPRREKGGGRRADAASALTAGRSEEPQPREGLGKASCRGIRFTSFRFPSPWASRTDGSAAAIPAPRGCPRGDASGAAPAARPDAPCSRPRPRTAPHRLAGSPQEEVGAGRARPGGGEPSPGRGAAAVFRCQGGGHLDRRGEGQSPPGAARLGREKPFLPAPGFLFVPSCVSNSARGCSKPLALRGRLGGGSYSRFRWFPSLCRGLRGVGGVGVPG